MLFLLPLESVAQISLHKSIGENITPKSIVHDNRGLFAAQNMMYKHSVSIYAANGVLLKTISDVVNLHQFGYTEYEDALYRGAPVEACFTPSGKFLWVSNYAMYGPGFNNEGCDGCLGSQYDPSFLYKINTLNYQIESVVKVGSVPKYLSISENGKLLLVSNWTSSDVSIIDLETEREIKRVKVGANPRGITIDKLNQKAYVAIMGGKKIAVVNLLNFSVSYIEGVGKAPRHLILDKANRFLYVAVNSANKIAKVNIITGEISYCKTNAGPRSMVMSADEAYLYVVNYYANTFQKIATNTMTVLETQSTFQKPIGIAGDWVNGRIWVSCYSGKIQIFNDASLPKAKSTPLVENNFTYAKIKLAGALDGMFEKPAQKEADLSLTFSNFQTDFYDSESSRGVVSSGSVKNTTPIGSNHLYKVIVGSFTSFENAKYLQSLLMTQELNAKLIPSANGKYMMVSVGEYDDSKMASSQIEQLKLQHHLNAWVYKPDR